MSSCSNASAFRARTWASRCSRPRSPSSTTSVSCRPSRRRASCARPARRCRGAGTPSPGAGTSRKRTAVSRTPTRCGGPASTSSCSNTARVPACAYGRARRCVPSTNTASNSRVERASKPAWSWTRRGSAPCSPVPTACRSGTLLPQPGRVRLLRRRPPPRPARRGQHLHRGVRTRVAVEDPAVRRRLQRRRRGGPRVRRRGNPPARPRAFLPRAGRRGQPGRAPCSRARDCATVRSPCGTGRGARAP